MVFRPLLLGTLDCICRLLVSFVRADLELRLDRVVRVDILPTEFLPAVARDVANLVLGFAGDFLKVTVLLLEVLPTGVG